MNDRATGDFFGALALELHAAGQRAPRRRIGLGDVVGGVAATALLAVAVFVALTVLGGGDTSEPPVEPAAQPAPVGTVIPKGEGSPPRTRRSTVVATGTARGIGPWQLEASRSVRLADPETGEVYQPAGLRCLTLYLLDPHDDRTLGASGQCGEFPRTPGFSRLQSGPSLPQSASSRPDSGATRPQSGAKRVLVYGRVPERAAAVSILVPGRGSINARLHEGPKTSRGNFYAVSVKPPLPRARINWFDGKGRPGSRGISLMPPITR